MPNTPVRGTQFSRRDALRLAAVAVPAVAAMGLPGFTGVAAAAAVKPSSATTGVPAGTRLTRHNGDIVVTTPGTILDALDIYGFVKIRAANVTVKRCRVRGSGPGTNNTGLVDCNNANVRNALIQDCLLVPDHPSVWLDGVIGKERSTPPGAATCTTPSTGSVRTTRPTGRHRRTSPSTAATSTICRISRKTRITATVPPTTMPSDPGWRQHQDPRQQRPGSCDVVVGG